MVLLCKECKLLPKHVSKKGRVHPRCKDCHFNYCKNLKNFNRERNHVLHKIWLEKNKEHIKEYSRNKRLGIIPTNPEIASRSWINSLKEKPCVDCRKQLSLVSNGF